LAPAFCAPKAGVGSSDPRRPGGELAQLSGDGAHELAALRDGPWRGGRGR
jgi:hypothetical protein